MLPAEFYAHHMLRFDRENVIAEAEVRGLLHKHGFSVANLSSRLTEGGKQFEYRMVIRSKDRKNGETLAEHLRGLPEVLEFRISPTGD
jgi:putative Mg2+ transporter-C (MgtC) family protein